MVLIEREAQRESLLCSCVCLCAVCVGVCVCVRCRNTDDKHADIISGHRGREKLEEEQPAQSPSGL